MDDEKTSGGEEESMQAILQFLPGVVAASAAFFVTRLFGWTELGFEFSTFLVAYTVVAISVDRGMKRYGARHP